jgi:copper chaperone
MEKTVLNVEGMSCEHCVKAVKDALQNLTISVEVDLKAATVAVSYDPAKTTIAAIKAAIEDQGYEIKG